MSQQLWLAGLLTLVLAGCQPQVTGDTNNSVPGNILSTAKDGQAKHRPALIDTPTPEEADDLQQEYAVRCSSPEACSPSVGLLIARMGDTQLGLCTTFLVDAQTVMTNKHCLPPELMLAGASCSNQITFKFPATASSEEVHAECDSIVSVSPYDVNGGAKEQTDYAILRLAHPVKRPALTLNANGVSDGQVVNLISMNPDNDARMGTISKKTCHATQNTLVTPTFTNDKSPVIQLSDCPIIHGNSGSPILNASGEVIAIAEQGADLNELTGPARDFVKKPFGRGTNFACVREPSIGLKGSNDPACNADLSEAGRDAALQALSTKVYDQKQMVADLTAEFTKWSAAAPAMVQWTLSEVTPTSAETAAHISSKLMTTPACVTPNHWLEKYKIKKPSLTSGKYEKTATVQLEVQVLSFAFVVDDELRGRLEKKISSENSTLTIAPAQFATSGQMNVTLATTTAAGGVTSANFALQACSPQASQASR